MAGELAALFAAAFFAATLLPAQSEAGLAYLVTSTPAHAVLFIAVASLGNTLGAVVNWALGRAVLRGRDKSWFPVKRDRLARAETWYRRYGHWSLLLSWAPIVGDPLTLVAGLLREPFWRFLALVAIAKTARYVIVAAVAAAVF